MSRRYRVRDRVFTVLCGFSRNEQGAVFIWMGAAVFALAAIGAFAVDMGYVYMLRAKLQTTADAAALAAASSLQDETQASDLALDLASANMSVAGHGNVLQGGDVRFGIWDQSTLTFQDGGSPVNAVQVVVRREGANGNSVPTFFANLMGVEEIDLSARAVAITGPPACILALDPDASDALSLDSNASIDVQGCNIHVNSSNSEGLSAYSTSQASADNICVVGDYAGGVSHYSPVPNVGCSPMIDPLATLPAPAYGGCTENNYFLGNDDEDTLSPGVYCGGIKIDSTATAHFDPGVYVITDGLFEVLSNSSVDGDGVVFYLTGTDSRVFFDSNSVVDFSAPTTGDFAGVVLFQDRNFGGLHRIDSNSNKTFEGALYFPNGELISDSNAAIGGTSPCMMIIAQQIHFNSNAGLEIDFDESACSVPIPGSATALVH